MRVARTAGAVRREIVPPYCKALWFRHVRGPHAGPLSRPGTGLESVYACFGESCENGRPRCQIISGKAIDATLSKLIVESVNPLALEVALSVQKELQWDNSWDLHRGL